VPHRSDSDLTGFSSQLFSDIAWSLQSFDRKAMTTKRWNLHPVADRIQREKDGLLQELENLKVVAARILAGEVYRRDGVLGLKQLSLACQI